MGITTFSKDAGVKNILLPDRIVTSPDKFADICWLLLAKINPISCGIYTFLLIPHDCEVFLFYN